jgi:hypothetical protein
MLVDVNGQLNNSRCLIYLVILVGQLSRVISMEPMPFERLPFLGHCDVHDWPFCPQDEVANGGMVMGKEQAD